MALARLVWHRLLLSYAILLVVAVALRLLTLQGLAKPVRIEGGSMAAGLLGAHLELDCEDCGVRFQCDARQVAAEGSAVCPNCGYGVGIGNARPQPGQRVLIDRAAFFVRPPRRWEVVAFSRDDRPRVRSVKRIVGLPGERLSIRHGDVYVDNRLQQKSLAQLRSMAILVHDASCEPRSIPQLTRWSPEVSPSGWRAAATGVVAAYRPRDDSGELDWLVYHHWPCMPRAFPASRRTDEWPVVDNYGFNQGLSRGTLNDVTDLLLAVDLTLSGTGHVVLASAYGRDFLELKLTWPDARLELCRNGKILQCYAARKNCPPRRPLKLELATCDGRVFVAINERLVATDSLGETARPASAPPGPVRIAASGLNVTVSRLQLWRDVYYLEPQGGGDDWTSKYELESDEYFLLGDNPPISIDSRQAISGVPRKALLGPVLSWVR